MSGSNRRTATRVLVAGAGALVAAAGAVSGMLVLDLEVADVLALPSSTHDLEGTVVVPFGGSTDPVPCRLTEDEAFEVLGGERSAPCPSGPLGDYRDVADGTVVNVLDGSGRPLGTTSLSGGVADGGTVTFRFVVKGLPEAEEYQVLVNTRGGVTYSEEELARAKWRAEVDLRT